MAVWPTFMKFHGSLSIALSLCVAAPAGLLAADAKKNAAPPSAPPALNEALAKPLALPDTVATVEGSEIKKAELEAAFNNVLAAQKIPVETISNDQRLQGYHELLNDIIVDKLLAKRSAETKVTDEEVNAKFEEIKSKIGSEEELKKQVEAAGETLEKVKTGLRDRLREERWLDEQLKDKVKVTDADAEDYYKKNPEQFKTPEQVRASHILVKVEPDAKPDVVVAKEKKAAAIVARVKKGEDFAKLAKELSEDPSAKQNSGDLDFFTRGHGPGIFQGGFCHEEGRDQCAGPQ